MSIDAQLDICGTSFSFNPKWWKKVGDIVSELAKNNNKKKTKENKRELDINIVLLRSKMTWMKTYQKSLQICTTEYTPSLRLGPQCSVDSIFHVKINIAIQGIYPASFQALQASTNWSWEGPFKNGRRKFLYNLNII